jgi:hypothetical protein
VAGNDPDDRDGGTRRASRLAVELDVGDLGRLRAAFVTEKLFLRMSFFGNSVLWLLVESLVKKLGLKMSILFSQAITSYEVLASTIDLPPS